MRIHGEWYRCDDNVLRPIFRGDIRTARGSWEPALFLVDTGADRTVMAADVMRLLGLTPTSTQHLLGGVGGVTLSVEVSTQIRFPRDDGGTSVFRGQFAGFTRGEILDMSVLGRDITDLFALIVDRPGGVVCLLSQRDRYRLETT